MSRKPPEILPHQPPFRFADSDGHAVVILPTAGAGESFPEPVPLTLITEAMAQAILLLHPPPTRDRLRLVAIDDAFLGGEVRAGDRLEVSCQPEAGFGTLRRFSCRAVRGGALVAQARITVGS
ncbi:MAG: hypothetical protein ACP5NF_08995 [Thermoanaerobaculum sp.]